MRDFTCFKADDVGGEIRLNIDEDIAYRNRRAVVQHISAKSVATGFGARETSSGFADVASRGVCDAGVTIVHDPKVIWNLRDTCSQNSSVSVQSKTGDAIIKQVMRAH